MSVCTTEIQNLTDSCLSMTLMLSSKVSGFGNVVVIEYQSGWRQVVVYNCSGLETDHGTGAGMTFTWGHTPRHAPCTHIYAG